MNDASHPDTPENRLSSTDPFGILPACAEVLRAWSGHPVEMNGRVQTFVGDLMRVQVQAWKKALGEKPNDAIQAVAYDERFQEPAWTASPYFDLLKEYYLLYTRSIEDAIFATPDVPQKTRRRAAFWIRQMLDAMSPSNFFWMNPAAITKAIETGGQSLVDGWQNLLKDATKSDISMVDENGSAVGKDIAATPGKVVFRNELLELIQYSPATEQVHTTPIMIVAPWINKYYVLDLSANKSLVRYLVNQGYTVFITSWKNPDGSMRDTAFEDYMTKGLLEAAKAAAAICEVPAVHAVGYCIGGTMLAALMAWLARGSAKEQSPILHWTLFTALTDFSDPGDIDVFITEDSVEWLELQMERHGFLDGGKMAASFRALRPNSLVWRYVVHNYLFGEEPPPMDVLQWNVDTTRLPAAMHSFYLREFYLANRMAHPDALVLAGRPVDLGRIETPLYMIGTEQDHIAPWKETFKLCGIMKGPVRYVLATSGHILGILSPPVNPPKRKYWAGDATGQTDPEAWRAGQDKVAGSWWEDWVKWLNERCGPMVDARKPGSKKYPPLAAAPGTYVLEK